MKVLVVSSILLLAAFLGHKIWHTIKTKKNANENIQQLPALTFQKLDRSVFHLDSFRNSKQLLVLNYFSPGCDHCQNMAKEMFHKQALLENVHWLMITSEKIATVQPFADSMKLTQLPNVTVLTDTALQFAKKFDAVLIPSFYVYKDRQLVRKHSGECSIQFLLQ